MADPTETRQSESLLSWEQIAKTDADLRTISSLTDYARNGGMSFELQGGYATEATVNGAITRPHSDIDGLLWFGKNPAGVIKRDVLSILSAEPTDWSEQPSAKSGYLEMVGESKPGKPKLSRRMELYMFPSPIIGVRSLVNRTIVDSSGQEHQVTVQPLEDLIAGKMQVLVKRDAQGEYERKHLGLRDTKDTDRDDLVALMTAPGFDKELSIRAIARSISRNMLGRITPDDAMPEAEKLWKQAVLLAQ